MSIGLFATGATSLVKKLGVSGDWLVLVCVLAGSFATYMSNFQPELWSALSGVLAATSATGNVALLQDLIVRFKGVR